MCHICGHGGIFQIGPAGKLRRSAGTAACGLARCLELSETQDNGLVALTLCLLHIVIWVQVPREGKCEPPLLGGGRRIIPFHACKPAFLWEAQGRGRCRMLLFIRVCVPFILQQCSLASLGAGKQEGRSALRVLLPPKLVVFPSLPPAFSVSLQERSAPDPASCSPRGPRWKTRKQY